VNAPPDTVPAALDEAARIHASRPALRIKRGGEWQSLTWGEYRALVRRVARGFLKLGLPPGGGVVILGRNCPEWFAADMAAIAAGGRPAGIYATSTGEQCAAIAAHSEAVVAVLEGPEALARLRAGGRPLPHLRAVVLLAGEAHGPGVCSWADLLALGEAVPEAELEARLRALRPEDCATLIYTSGTTGAPKAVMLSHRNLTWMGRQVRHYVGLRADDQLLSYLPLSHVAEQMNSLHAPLYAGACVSFVESLDELPQRLREVRPHLFFGVPRVWEKFQAAVEAGAAAAPAWRRGLLRWARRVGLAAGYAEQQGRRGPRALPLARRLVFDRVRRGVGLDRVRLCAVSAAPVARETLEFFLGLGLPLLEVYGMSECTAPATLSLPGRYRTGKAGAAIPGTELRLAQDGEILVRGPHVFLGYFKDESATREALDADGWLHTGDVGTLDAEGYLEVTDRKKEILITSGGKNIAPQVVETRLKQLPAVAHAVAVGDRRKFVAALVTLDPVRLPAAAERAGSPARDPAAAAACPIFRGHLETALRGINEGLASYESVKRLEVLAGEFTIEGGELTPSLKLRRRAVYEKYAARIEALYVDPERGPLRPPGAGERLAPE
jgi:long-subunit acyl-CoA synthetase (AMP-forming)